MLIQLEPIQVSKAKTFQEKCEDLLRAFAPSSPSAFGLFVLRYGR